MPNFYIYHYTYPYPISYPYRYPYPYQALDFTEAEVARYTRYARPQAMNGRLDATLSFSGSCG